MMHIYLAENTKILSNRVCQTVIETLSPDGSPTWSMANSFIYCGIVVEVRKASGAIFVCTEINATVERLATRTTHTPHEPSKRTYAIE